MKIIHIAAIAAAALASTAVSTVASAASFSGTFTHDNGKAGFYLYLMAPAIVSIESIGNASGGFDPVLSLYNPSGLGIAFNDDQDAGVSDPKLVESLSAGRYTVYLTQYDNFGPASLGLPFNFDDQPNFRGGFIDFYGAQRTGDWALSINGAFKAGAVPEPASWMMLIAGFGLVGAVKRRRAQRAVAA